MLGLRIGVDLGSASLHICVAGRGVVVSEPSVMVCDSDTGKPLAIGSAAEEMLGRLPNSMRAVHPVFDGVVDNFEAAQQLLLFLRQFQSQQPKACIQCLSHGPTSR